MVASAIDDWYGLHHHYFFAVNIVTEAVLDGRLDPEDGKHIKLNLRAAVKSAADGSDTVAHATDICKATEFKYQEGPHHASLS